MSILINVKKKIKKGGVNMARNRKLVPEATKALDQLKNEVATSIGVQLKPGYNGDLTTKQAGSIGGFMVKRMIQDYENRAAGK